MSNVTIEIPEDIAQYLLGWLEDEGEQYAIIPKTESGEYDIDAMEDEVMAGRAATPIDMLGQHQPPYAWLLASLYDALSWPNAFTSERQQESKRLVNEALMEAMKEQEEFLRRANEIGEEDQDGEA